MNKQSTIRAIQEALIGPRILNGGKLTEWWLKCEICGGEGFYGDRKSCAVEAWGSGWRIVGGKVTCNCDKG